MNARPVFHFTTQKNWINDPNGLVYFAGEYHLFFQHNPYGDTWGNMSWGHAVSPDLLHWQELPVAIPVTNDVAAFSGSAVVDWNNSSGFGKNAEPPLVVAYTGHHNNQNQAGFWPEDQRIAFSQDRGRTWQQYANNPVLENQKDFRDPKIFWHAPSARWVMMVSRAHEYVLKFYNSIDLKNWQHTSDCGPIPDIIGALEVPDLFELPIDNETGQTRWVLKIDATEGGPSGGSAGQYVIGWFDGKQFIADTENNGQKNWLDYGKDFYAALSWAEAPNNRHIFIAWMSNWQYAVKTPTSPWRSAMTTPRELSLRRTEHGLKLFQAPIPELKNLRQEHFALFETTIQTGQMPLAIRGTALEIQAEFELASATEFGFCVRRGEKNFTRIAYNATSQELFIDRTHSGNTSFSEHFSGIHAAPVQTNNNRLRLQILLDACSVEVFAQDGLLSITDLIFPESNDDNLELYARGGTVQLVALAVWKLG